MHSGKAQEDAALNVLDGTVTGQNMQRHRHQEFIRFLNKIEHDIPVGKVVHVILDNYAAHKHAKVRAWLERHPRWTFHFTPTSSSWLNAVEGFFAKLTRRRLRHGVFHSIVEAISKKLVNEILACVNLGRLAVAAAEERPRTASPASCTLRHRPGLGRECPRPRWQRPAQTRQRR